MKKCSFHCYYGWFCLSLSFSSLSTTTMKNRGGHVGVVAAAGAADGVVLQAVETTPAPTNRKEKKHVLIGFRDQDRMIKFEKARNQIFKNNRKNLLGLLSDNDNGDDDGDEDAKDETMKAIKRANAVKVEMDEDEITELMSRQGGDEDGIVYVEEDSFVKPLGEIIPYGIRLVDAKDEVVDQLRLEPSSTRTASCDDPTSFKIAIIDSGVDVNHPDLPFPQGENSDNVRGIEFGLTSSEKWYNPTDIHGTHVTGTISAIRDNNVGIQGIVPDASSNGVCFLVARVFGESVENARLSDILEAVEWAADQGADVMNLSLGGALFSTTAGVLYQTIRNSGTLVISAAGNDGTSDKSYPASYTSVLSVAAVDENSSWAEFSQHNDQVDIAAPGAGILSTIPRGLNLGSITTVSFDDAAAANAPAVSGSLMAGSATPPEPNGISGILVECPDLGQGACNIPSTSGLDSYICIIERGEITFEQKALNCQLSGGSGVLIYNNEAGLIAGTLETPTQVSIPVAGLKRDDGLTLLQNVGQRVTVNAQDGYTYSDGTSFASPHVAGVASAVWNACGVGSCTVDDVQFCLQDGALDLGFTGKDEYYGYGLVQLEGTYSCLQNKRKCCARAGGGTGGGATDGATADDGGSYNGNGGEDNTTGGGGGYTQPTDCSMSEPAYQGCLLGLNEFVADNCRACVNDFIPFNVFATSCGYLNSQLCPAVYELCTDCAPCVNDIDFFLTCAIRDINLCDLDCEQERDRNVSNNNSGNNNNDNIFGDGNVPVESIERGSDSNGDIQLTCTEELLDMRECFAMNEAIVAPTVVRLSANGTSSVQSCGACIEDAFASVLSDGGSQDSYAASPCSAVRDGVCPAVQRCGCAVCEAETEAYATCRIRAASNGDCTAADGSDSFCPVVAGAGTGSGGDAAAGASTDFSSAAGSSDCWNPIRWTLILLSSVYWLSAWDVLS